MPRIRFTIIPGHPDGKFRPDSFDHMLQSAVMAPGLDSGYEHTLVEAVVADDGRSADLAVESVPVSRVRPLDAAFRVVNGTPAAKVRAFHHENLDDPLVELQLDAPLQRGQRVAVGEQEYLVHAEHWPHRDPVTQACAGGVDWQHAHLVPVDPVDSMVQQVHRHSVAGRPGSPVPPAVPGAVEALKESL